MHLFQLQDNSWGPRKSEAEGASKLLSDSSLKSKRKKKKSLKSYQDVLILNIKNYTSVSHLYKSLS